jgi:general secretion pathway protein G
MRLRERPAVVRSGFTLMEMLVVVAILVVLAGAAVPIYMNYLENAKKDRAKIDCKALTTAVEAYKLRYGDYPPSLQALTQNAPDGSLPTLEPSALFDPWQHEYQYSPQGQHNAAYGKADIWSLGPRLNDPNGIIGNWSAAMGPGGQ